MKQTFKKSMAIILATLMLLTAAPLSGFVGMEWPELNLPDWTLSQSDKVTAFHDTADAAVVNQSGVIDTKDLIAGDEDGLTRVEWLHNITVLFDMTVHENNIPDNYFADLSSDSEYYYDILLAVEFGVVDIPAGGEVLPEDPATRDFAASTLNFCLGFVLEEEEYTFSDIDAVSNAQHAQIAINRGWFELIDGAFSPETPVTASEVEAMIADATEVIEGSVVGESTENYIVFADFVKELDKTTVFEYNENGDVVLYDYEGEDLAAGDVIALYGSELPSVYTVTSVTTETATEEVVEEETEEEIIEIITLGVEFYEGEDSAVLDMVAEGTMDVDLNQFEAAEGITYDIVTDGPVRVGGISYKNGKLLATKDFKLGSGVKVDFSFELSNLKTPINVNIKKGIYQIEVVGDVKINCTGKINTVQMAGLPSTVTIGYVNIAGIGKAEVTVNIALAAQLSFTYTGKLSAGIQYKNSSFRLISRFEKANFCCVLEVDGSVELMFNVGINLAGVLKGNIYAKAGMKGKYTNVIADGTGINCVTIEAWMIASVGANASLNLLVVKKEFSKNHTIFDKSNSPIRVNLHYEDGVQVFECSKDKAGSEGGTGGSGGSGGTGSSGSKQYVSPPTTRYGASGSRNVSSTSTYGGEVYTHYDYTLDSNNNATITKYYGNASALILPETIDGYTVTTIGSNVFKNNKNLYSVFIPDTVTTIGYDAFLGCTNLTTVQLSKNLTSIGSSAFSGCTNLNSIQLPASLVEIGYNAFYNCDSLTSINIPKSLTTVTTQYYYNDLAAPFADCDNLKSVEFEEGITSIAAYLFQYCSGLENIIIPNTVTTIGREAFENCTSLSSVQLPASLVELGYYAFYNCDSLTSINIPKSLTTVTTQYSYNDLAAPFADCDNLKSVEFEEGITSIAAYLFQYCSGLENIIIPNTVTTIGREAFENCTSLSSVQLPASLVELGYYAFYNCDSLTSINIPKSLTTVTTQYSYNDLAAPFADCDNLKSVEFEEGITSIAAYLFQYCSGLENIIIPNTVTTIGSLAFVGCSNLKSVQLSADLTSIGEEAFYSCASLSDLVIPDKVTSIKKSAFQNCSSLKTIVIPKSVNSLGTFAFYGCSALETATLPSQITSIPNSLFSGCSSLKTIAIPNTVKTIGSSAFANCKALENFTFPNGSSVETINSSAFSGCESLTEVRIPDGVKTVSSYAFQNCTALEKVSIPQSVKTISNQAFIGCEKLANVTFADYSITTLADSIFMDIPALKEIVLPKGLTTISNQAFRNCTGLVKITIPASVTSIVTNALSYPDKTVICGVKGSYAETFATENGFQFVDIGVPAQGFSLKDGIESIDLEAGEKFIAEFEFFPADSTDCISMKAGSSAVSVAGMELTAKSKGSTVVTATTTSGLTYEFTVNVRTVKNIQVTQMPTKTTFKLGEELDLTGMVLTVNYSDNTTKQVTDYTVSGYNNSVEGENKITIKWIALNGSSYSTTLTLNIVDPNPKVTGIVIDTLPVKTVYNRGESLDLTGLVVTANYTDGSSAVITDYTVSGYNALKYDAQTITVTYKEFTATFTVTVTRPHTCTAGDWEIITPATCTAVGTKVQKCAECGTVMATQEIPALGHDYVGTITTQPTCTTKGVKTYTCANCGDTYTEELAELGHTPGAAVTEDKIEATCTEDGAYNMVVYCATCGEKLSTTPYTITAFGHTPGADATCTEDQTCTVCGEILTAKLGHTPGADATCTEDQVCTVCGEILTAKLGHDYDSVVTAPTCEEDGFTTYTCANCADTYVADETAAIGHSWDEGIVTTEPTTETDGVMTYTCTVCSETKTETIEKLQGSFTESEDAVITEDGNICTMVGKTAESLLAQAGAAATLVDKKGNTLTADAKVGTGAVLTLADGTQYEIIVPGDCDGDAAITSGDARFALRYSVGLEDAQAGTVYAAAADVDTAAGVAAGDARAILRASVGLDNPDEWFEKLR